MAIAAEQDGEGTLLRLTESLTIYEVLELQQQFVTILTEPTENIRFDLSEIEEMDLAGFQLLLQFKNEIIARDLKFTISECSDAVRNAAATCGMSDVIAV